MKIFRQLFCSHIYKSTDRVLLHWSRERDGGFDFLTGQFPTYSNFVYSALTETCLKCGKTKISRHRQDIGNQVPENLINK